jgi:hypothetical protein
LSEGMIAILQPVCPKIWERYFAPSHGQARKEHLQEVNRRPLKEGLLLQGPKRGNPTWGLVAKDPHSNTSFFN